eukprot:GHVU01053829.1.p1 GENE.GHVU01053829.1~~GHVU01053829.1.p1  ORF type:complete len:118 (-),score=27.74 GHVU01053829.1:42-395(-)
MCDFEEAANADSSSPAPPPPSSSSSSSLRRSWWASAPRGASAAVAPVATPEAEADAHAAAKVSSSAQHMAWRCSEVESSSCSRGNCRRSGSVEDPPPSHTPRRSLAGRQSGRQAVRQ